MNKSQVTLGIIYLAIGALCLGTALLFETKLAPLLWGFAGAGIGIGITGLCKYYYWTSPKNAERYSEKTAKEDIDLHDELKNKVRGKAAQDIYQINLVILSISMVLFAIASLMDILPGAGIFMAYISVLFVLQYVIGHFCYKRNMKKYM